MASFPKPLIAAVNGLGVGWGMTILAHCDFVLMSTTAKLKTPFVQLGLTAEAGSSVTFAERFGWQKAAYILMSSDWIDAEESLRIGLALRVVAPDRLLPETLDFARKLAAGPIESLVATKRLMLAGGRAEQVMAAHQREMAAYSRGAAPLMGGPANREAVRAAFAEKRPPDFSRL